MHRDCCTPHRELRSMEETVVASCSTVVQRGFVKKQAASLLVTPKFAGASSITGALISAFVSADDTVAIALCIVA